MKRKIELVTAAKKGEEEHARRKIACKEYHAQYRRLHRDAAHEVDRHLGITRVGTQWAAHEIDEEPIQKGCYSEEEVSNMDKDGIFHPISEDSKQSVYKEGSERVNRLKWLDDVPAAHRREYDVSSSLPQMKGALLSPRGLVRQLDGKPCGLLQVCCSCFNSLQSHWNLPPKFAVANGFDIGVLPSDLLNATWIERAMSSVTSVAASITVLRGGRHKSLRGHVTVVTLDPGSISRRLPVILSGKENFFVLMASSLTPQQRLSELRKYKARRDVISRLLEFYVSNNIVYRDTGVQIDREALKYLETKGRSANEEPLFCQELEYGYRQGIQEQVSPIKSNASKYPESETRYLEESFVAVRSDESTTIEILDAAKEVLAIRNHRRLVFEFERRLLAFAFPDLFLRGRGHPGTRRQVFVFALFDICEKRRVPTSETVRSLYRAEEFEKISNLSREQGIDAIKSKKKRTKPANPRTRGRY